MTGAWLSAFNHYCSVVTTFEELWQKQTAQFTCAVNLLILKHASYYSDRYGHAVLLDHLVGMRCFIVDSLLAQ